MSHYQLDARRLLCPLPVIRTQDRVNTLLAGDTLDVTSTDPGTVNDIPAWCRINGHTILNIETTAALIKITIKVGRPN